MNVIQLTSVRIRRRHHHSPLKKGRHQRRNHLVLLRVFAAHQPTSSAIKQTFIHTPHRGEGARSMPPLQNQTSLSPPRRVSLHIHTHTPPHRYTTHSHTQHTTPAYKDTAGVSDLTKHNQRTTWCDLPLQRQWRCPAVCTAAVQ